jgi:hypothetical protein
MASNIPSRGRRTVLTEAKLKRCIQAAKDAGLEVKQVTVSPDGAITLSAADNNNSKKPQNGGTWDDI